MSRLAKTIKSIVLASTFALGGMSAAWAAENDALKLAWTFETGAPLNFAPVVAGDKVLTTPLGGHLYALDAATGKVKWEYNPPEGVWDRSHETDGENVYVCLQGGKLAALDAANGKELWRTELGINCQRQGHIAGDTIYVPTTFVGIGLPGTPLTGAKLFAVNRADGKIKWSFTSETYLLQTPTTNSDTVFVGGSYKDPNFKEEEGGPARYYALDAKTGEKKWEMLSVDGLVKALYATEEVLSFIAYQDFIQTFDAKTGKFLWKRDTENWTPSLTGKDGVVYFGSANTFVHAWAAKDGKVLWRYNIPGGRAFDYLLIKPILTDGRLYFMSQRGYVYALDPKDAKELWAYSTGMNSRVGISVGNGHIYMGDKDGRVYGYKILK